MQYMNGISVQVNQGLGTLVMLHLMSQKHVYLMEKCVEMYWTVMKKLAHANNLVTQKKMVLFVPIPKTHCVQNQVLIFVIQLLAFVFQMQIAVMVVQ